MIVHRWLVSLSILCFQYPLFTSQREETFGLAETENLVIIVLVPLTGQYGNIGQSIKPFINRALQEMNTNQTILQDYRLVPTWVDTKCEMASASRALFDSMHTNDNVVFIFGGLCNIVTKPIAETVHSFNIWQISFANTDPTLSDSTTYKNFLRVIPNELDLNYLWISLLQNYNWTRVGLLFQDASVGVSSYAYVHDAMMSLIKSTGMNITLTVNVADDNPETALRQITDTDTRIIISNFDHQIAIKTICAAYHLGMFGYKYVWILPSNYPRHWWKHYPSDNCTLDQIVQALDGHFIADIMDKHQTDVLQEVKDYSFTEAPSSQARSDISSYQGYAYDAVKLMAHSLDRFIKREQPNVSWNEWRQLTTYSDIVSGLTFSGMTGEVKFQGRRRLGQLQLKQMQGDDYVKVADFDMSADQIAFNTQPLSWHGSNPPLDRMIRENRKLQPNKAIQTLLIVLASLGLVMAISFLAVNIKYAAHRHIKMSSPKMNNLIIAGCILVYCNIYMMRINPSKVTTHTYQAICILRSWVLAVGFSLSFGALFAKTWRVYTIFNSPHSQKRVITDTTLFAIVTVLTLIDIILLSLWTTLDPLKVHLGYLEPIEEENILINRIYYTCKSEKLMVVWSAIMYTYKGLLLVVGCFFAWQTRHVNIPALNDSKYIGMSVYNVVIMCASAVSISYVISEQQDYSHLITGLLIILCTTITLCLVFVPKITHLRKDPEDTTPRPRLSMQKRSLSSKRRLSKQQSAQEAEEVKKSITEQEQEVTNRQLRLNEIKAEVKRLENLYKMKSVHQQSTIYSISSQDEYDMAHHSEDSNNKPHVAELNAEVFSDPAYTEYRTPNDTRSKSRQSSTRSTGLHRDTSLLITQLCEEADISKITPL